MLSFCPFCMMVAVCGFSILVFLMELTLFGLVCEELALVAALFYFFYYIADCNM